MRPPRASALDRFLRYVRIDTQSAEGEETVPSTPSQLVLAHLLVDELQSLGAQDVRVTEFGLVYGMVPGSPSAGAAVPVIGFIAHMDTSPAAPGRDVNVVIHRDYRGGDIVLPADPAQVIRVKDNPDLETLIGDDIITADGTTLLGSDDKAGIAEILTMVDILRENPQIPHGRVAIAFTPDEETSKGVLHFDVPGFGAAFAYTVDGWGLGEISDETWNARTATVTFKGVSTHPGLAKGELVNAAYALGDFLKRFPPEMRPEATEGREGFIHPYEGTVDVGEATLTVALRSFEREGLDAQEQVLRDMIEATGGRFPRVEIGLHVEERYRNIKEVLQHHPELVEYAMEATRRAGLVPRLKPLRGGSDGSVLTFRGLPTPDLFTGGHNAHGLLEFNSVGGLEKTTETLVQLVAVLATAATAAAAAGSPG